LPTFTKGLTVEALLAKSIMAMSYNKAPLTTDFLHKAGKEKTAKNSMKINSQN
jgi:hypothetical protein